MAIKLGALWAKETKLGTILTGNIIINGVEKKIVCFSNKNKTKETQPDWNIQESEPMTYNNNPRRVINPHAGRGSYDNKVPDQSNDVGFDDDDIPF